IPVTLVLPLADRFQALADPTRLRILALLRRMELSVGELAQVLGQSQPRVSRHLKILSDAGVLERRKEGSWVFLTLEYPAAFLAALQHPGVGQDLEVARDARLALPEHLRKLPHRQLHPPQQGEDA